MSQGERRLAAIMFTDMVGYTALGQRNESLSLALVEEQRKLIRPILARHNGREVKTIGDAFLVEFGSALDAVICAYEIQRSTKEFNLPLTEDKRVHIRIGVHLGDVVESEGDISGDAVNVASRIEPLAEDGGVSITRQVYDHVKGKVDIQLSSMGPKALKNVTDPVEVFKMVMPWVREGAVSAQELSPKRIAVLPFANMSPDPNDEYFADGMTEELIDRLAQVKELEVIARTSVMSYKGEKRKALQIAKELLVGSLVEGSVRKAGNRVRVTAQLINGATEGNLWSSHYDGTMDDIFAIQSKIAEQVARELEVRLLGQEKQRLEGKPTLSTEAYTLYLKGRHFLNERSKEGTTKAIRYFEEAVKLDSQFSQAYSGLSDSYSIAVDYGWSRPAEGLQKAMVYARRAVEIDPLLAEGHASLGSVLGDFEWKWDEALKEFDRAIELKPSYALARQWRARNLETRGKHREAFEELGRARNLDPLSRVIGLNYGTEMVYLGMVEQGIGQLREVIEMNPDYPGAHLYLGLTYLLGERYEESVREVEIAAELSDGDLYIKTQLCFVYGKTGREKQATKVLEELLEAERSANISDVWMATAFAGVGRLDEAFDRLESALAKRSAQLLFFREYPWLEEIRKDPRWIAIEERVSHLAP